MGSALMSRSEDGKIVRLMKITVNVDCTPTEARALLGLPDVSPVNKAIVDAMVERTKENIDTLSDPKLFWERAMALGGSSMEAMQNLFGSAMRGKD
jgi:hypothetical protein